MKKTDNFTQTIISTFGLAISLIVAILPLFSRGFLTGLFINKSLVIPASFLSFMIGVAIIWQIIEFQPYPQINIGKLIDRGRGYREPWKSINTSQLIWVLIILDIIFSLFFFYLSNFKENILLGLIQTLLYIGFFLGLITVFAILFSQTRQKFVWEENRDTFSQTVFNTLEKHRLIKPWIEIYENRILSPEEMNQEGIKGIIFARRMKIKTSIQKEEVIEFIVSSDGKEIIKVLKKGK